MNDILSLIQRAKNSIALGESHFREFKTAMEGKPGSKRPRRTTKICQEIGEALVAFTNADGGELFIGVEDDGTITGLQHSPEVISTMLDAYRSQILNPADLPLLRNQLITIDDKQILFFSVDKSTNKIFQLCDGRCMQRKDKSSMPADFARIQFERTEAASREYDRVFVDGATVNDLDVVLVRQVSDLYFSGMSPEQYLQQVNLAEYGLSGLKLKRAALLLFAKDIGRWFACCKIRILKVNGDQILPGDKYNVISDDYITGNIFTLLASGWERLRPYLSQKTSFNSEAKFEQVFVYPENACREALVNAIAHRDYSSSNPVTIYIYDHKLVFESPGELLSTISINHLQNGLGVHESRNSTISRVLRENKYMRELGEGMRRIYALMEEQELARPEISSSQGKFTIALTHKSIYSEREQLWLSLFRQFDLTQHQKRIVIAGIDDRPLSPSMIYQAMGSNDRNLYDRSVSVLRNLGILDEIISNAEATRLSRSKNKPKSEIERFIVVKPSLIKQVDSVSTKVFVYDLPVDIDRETLQIAMSIFGFVRDCYIPQDQDRRPKGFAFVDFDNSEDALKAVAIKRINIGDHIAGILPFKVNRARGKK